MGTAELPSFVTCSERVGGVGVRLYLPVLNERPFSKRERAPCSAWTLIPLRELLLGLRPIGWYLYGVPFSFLKNALQGEKTRQEILNDIIAKSKERKLEKARGKEEQESERERLDEGMEELLGFLHQRPTKKDEVIATRGQSDDYDLTMRVRVTAVVAGSSSFWPAGIPNILSQDNRESRCMKGTD